MVLRRTGLVTALVAVAAGLLAALPDTTASAVGPGSGGTFVPVTPGNIWTSAGSGGDMQAGSSREVQVTGVGGVPSAGVGAVVIEVHGYSNGSSHIAVSPKGGPAWSPVLKLTSDQDQHSNTALVPPGTGGKIVVTSSAGSSTKLTIDVQGYFTAVSGDGAPGGYVPVMPERVLATHEAVGLTGPLNAGSNYSVQVAGVGDIPEDATAVFANVRVLNATQAGGLYAGTSSPVPGTWNALAYESGRYNDSGLALKLSATGKVHLRPSHGSIHVIVDVQGYFSPGEGQGGAYTPLSNGYYYDSYALSTPLAAGETRAIPVLGKGNIPDSESVGSIVTTIQAHNWTPSGGGALVAYNPDTGRNGTSSVAFSGTYTMPEMSTSVVGVSTEGTIELHNYSDRSVHILLAAQGYFSRPEVDVPADDVEQDSVDVVPCETTDCPPVLVTGEAPGAIEDLKVFVDPTDGITAPDDVETPMIELSAAEVAAEGNAFTVRVDPADVSQSHVSDDGVINLNVMGSGGTQDWETTVSAQVVAPEDQPGAEWASVNDVTDPSLTAAPSSLSRPAASAASTALAIPQPVELTADATFKPAIARSSNMLVQPTNLPITICSTKWLNQRKRPWATIGTTYPTDGATGTMAISSSRGSEYGIGVSVGGGAFKASGTNFAKGSWSKTWVNSKSSRSYRTQVEYRKKEKRCSGPGGPPRYYTYWVPISEVGSARSTTGISRPNWTKCAEIDPGIWERDQSKGSNYTYGASVKFKDYLGVDLSISREYSKASKLTYNLKRVGRVCGNNAWPATASKVMVKKR